MDWIETDIEVSEDSNLYIAEEDGKIVAGYFNGDDFIEMTEEEIEEYNVMEIASGYLLNMQQHIEQKQKAQTRQGQRAQTRQKQKQKAQTKQKQKAQAKQKTTKQKSGSKLGLFIFVQLIIIGAVGFAGYRMYEKTQYLQQELSKVNQNLVGSVQEFDDDGNRIIGYTSDMEPIIAKEPNGEDKIGKVKYNDDKLPYITVRVFNNENSIIKEEKIVKSSAGLVKSEEELKEEKKRLEQKKKEEEEKEKQKKELEFREQFRKDKSVMKLSKEFFTHPQNKNIIKETEFRDLNLIPKTKEDNKFVVYNYNGNLLPYSEQDYVNREVYGYILDYEFFKNINLDVKRVGDDNAEVSIEENKDTTGKLVDKAIEAVIKRNFYTDFIHENIPVYKSNITQKLNSIVGDSSTIAENFTLYEYKKVDGYIGDINARLYPLMKADIEKSRENKLTKEQITNYMYDYYKDLIEIKLQGKKDLACIEMNEFSSGSCNNKSTVNTLDIKSDYIEQVYLEALTDTLKYYTELLGIVYNDTMK